MEGFGRGRHFGENGGQAYVVSHTLVESRGKRPTWRPNFESGETKRKGTLSSREGCQGKKANEKKSKGGEGHI